ncbi:MAG: hypothetical protein WA003_14775 [Desulfuromonadaceae bacterium]
MLKEALLAAQMPRGDVVGVSGVAGSTGGATLIHGVGPAEKPMAGQRQAVPLEGGLYKMFDRVCGFTIERVFASRMILTYSESIKKSRM